MTRFLTSSIGACLIMVGILACDDEGVQDGIDPGIGVRISGKSLQLGDNYSTIESRFGAPATVRDMDSVGVRFTLPLIHVAGFLSGTGDDAVVTSLTLEPGFNGLTPEGIGLGGDEASVRAGFGTPLTESFTTNWWYHDAGMIFEWRDGGIHRIHIMPARETD